jgi:hypothetical protein
MPRRIRAFRTGVIVHRSTPQSGRCSASAEMLFRPRNVAAAWRYRLGRVSEIGAQSSADADLPASATHPAVAANRRYYLAALYDAMPGRNVPSCKQRRDQDLDCEARLGIHLVGEKTPVRLVSPQPISDVALPDQDLDQQAV